MLTQLYICSYNASSLAVVLNASLLNVPALFSEACNNRPLRIREVLIGMSGCSSAYKRIVSSA